MAKMISPHFSYNEMVCRCGKCKRADMDPDFMKLLEEIRKANGSRAADVLISGAAASELFMVARQVGANGLGVSQKGNHKDRFIHIDGVDRPEQAMWSY